MSNIESFPTSETDADMYGTDERMAGLSEKDYQGGATPLDHTGEPEQNYVRDPAESTGLRRITEKEATKLILQGKGGKVIKPWMLVENDSNPAE